MSNLTKPPILDETGQDILSALADIKRNLPQGGGSNGYAPTDATEATLADDDKMPFYDTSASGKRNSTWANIKAKLKIFFDTIYARNLYYDELYEPSQYNTNTHKFWGRGLFNCSLESAPNKFTDFADAIVTATNDHANTIAKLRVELTLAEFNALTPAEQDDPEIVYYITDKPSLGYPIQDDGSATDLTDGALQTGRTIENWASKKYSPISIAPQLLCGNTLLAVSGNATLTLNNWKLFKDLYIRVVYSYSGTMTDICAPVIVPVDFLKYCNSGQCRLAVHINSQYTGGILLSDITDNTMKITNMVSNTAITVAVWGRV